MGQVAKRLNMSPKTLARTLAGEREFRASEREALPHVLGVPEWFLASGLSGAPFANGADALHSRVEQALVAAAAPVMRQLAEDLTARVARAIEEARPGAAPEDRPHVPTPGEGPAGLR